MKMVKGGKGPEQFDADNSENLMGDTGVCDLRNRRPGRCRSAVAGLMFKAEMSRRPRGG